MLHLSLAAGRQFDFFYIIWSCVRPALFGCRSSVRFFLTSLVVCSTLVWLFLSFGLLFSCLVVYCSTLFLTLLIIRFLVVYCLFFSRALPLCLPYMYLPPQPFFGRFIVLFGVYRSSVYNFVPAFLFILSCVLVCIFMLIRKNNIFFLIYFRANMRMGFSHDMSNYSKEKKKKKKAFSSS